MKSIFINILIALSLVASNLYGGTNKFENLRNPFIPLTEKSCKEIRGQSMTLEGVVYAGTKRSAAILARGGQREVVQRGTRFAGYQLVTIGKDFVVLARGNQRKRLNID